MIFMNWHFGKMIDNEEMYSQFTIEARMVGTHGCLSKGLISYKTILK